MKPNPRILTLLACAFSAVLVCAEPAKPKDESATPGAPIEYFGQAPKDLKILAEHRVIARYDGCPFQTCDGATGLCPEHCDGSGEFATFLVKDYLFHANHDDYEGTRDKSFRMRISDFDRKPLGDPKLNSMIAKLTKGDLVLMEWKHLYGKVSPNALGSVRPVIQLKKISLPEADALRAEAKKGKK